MGGGWIGDKTLAAVGVIYDRTATGFSVQFQAMQGLRKVVRAHFSQSGEDIVAVADTCGSDDAPFVGPLMDEASLNSGNIATAADNGQYGVFGVVAGFEKTIDALPEDADAVEVKVGRLRLNVKDDQTFALPLSGDGAFEFAGSGVPVSKSRVFGKFLTASDQIVATNTPIGALTITAGEMGGDWCGSSGTLNLEPLNVTWNDEKTAFTVQFQWNNGTYLKAVAAQFAQMGADVVGKVIKAAQAKGLGSYGTDMLSDGDNWPSAGVSIATSATAPGYGLAAFAYAATKLPEVAWSGEKRLTGGVTVSGCEVTLVGHSAAEKSTVTVKDGGVLYLRAPGTNAVLRYVTYVVEPGSVLNAGGVSFAINDGDRVVLDGATVNWDTANVNYFNAVTAHDDCRLAVAPGLDAGISVGFNGDATWATSGDGVLVVAGRVRLTSTVAQTRTFSLAAEEDICFKDDVYEYDDSLYRGMKVVKRGAATVTFEKGCRTSGSLRVTGGALSFGADSSFGALAVGADDVTLAVAAGRTIAFADSSAESWGDGLVSFTLADGARVTFGTNEKALSPAQRRKIRVNGERVYLDKTGELRVGRPLVLLIR